jgi:predicted ribonuclease YlaK
VFGLNVKSVNSNNKIEYKGYTQKVMSEVEMAYFYENLNKNIYNLLINEYLVVKNKSGEVEDCYRWNGEKHLSLYKKPIKSITFGDKIKPKDIYQSMVIDSIINNTITTISGKAGSGKSLLSLVVAMHLIESGKYDKLIVMFNPSKTRGASDMGFYGGSFIEKAMQNSIGNILITKFGDKCAVEMLMQQEKLRLVSVADARGMEIRDNEILYLTECQNTSVELLKLCLSRASSGSKIIIEGDFTSQVDSYLYDGNNNGMKRAIEVLKGEDIFGYIELQNIWRSKLAELVDKF